MPRQYGYKTKRFITTNKKLVAALMQFKTVNELIQELNWNHSTVRYHLRYLENTGLIESKPRRAFGRSELEYKVIS